MVIRVNQAQELLDIKCPACGSSILTDESKAESIWARYSVAKATPERQLVDAKKFVSGLKCKNCVSNPKIKTSYSFTPVESDVLDDE